MSLRVKMKIIEFESPIIWCCYLDNCWLTTWSKGINIWNPGYNLIYPDGNVKSFPRRLRLPGNVLAFIENNGLNSIQRVKSPQIQKNFMNIKSKTPYMKNINLNLLIKLLIQPWQGFFVYSLGK